MSPIRDYPERNLMMKIISFLFLFSIFAIFYTYIGYGLTLLLITVFRTRTVYKKVFYPMVTFIVTAYNEDTQIGEKIVNTLALDYPREAIQILIVSDGSTDGTNEIVRQYAINGIELLALEARLGKENAQKRAVDVARGDILVFSDTATRLDPSGLKELVANFSDPSVGCVSSEDRIYQRNSLYSGENFYVRYEMWLRYLESLVNSVVGLSGSFFAARKAVFFHDFKGEMQSDFRTLLNSLKLGLRGVSDSKAIGYYFDLESDDKEIARKIRTITRGLYVFFNHLEFLNPFRYGLFSYQYFCHKLLRWSVPFFLFMAFVSNLILAQESRVALALIFLQVCFYLAAVAGWVKLSLRKKIWFKIPYYLAAMNLATLVAWRNFLRGDRIIMWEPSKR